MRTVSGSRRWLVNCDMPGRRRSTSACRSASLSAKPGGQPSTTQPSAGPWLSPKLVTVNPRPNVFPAARRFSFLETLSDVPSDVPSGNAPPSAPTEPPATCGRGARIGAHFFQIPGPQQEYPAAAHGDFRPDERQAGKGALQSLFCIADFHDQYPVAA